MTIIEGVAGKGRLTPYAWESMPLIYSLPKVFSGSPLTLTLSHKGRGEFKEITFGNRYKWLYYGKCGDISMLAT
jgi:hypothetical protein